MKKILFAVAVILMFGGCSKLDGVVTVVGAVNEYNPDTKSREALKAYDSIRKEVRSLQDSKKQDANTSKVLKN